MATLLVQTVDRTGIVPTLNAVSASDKFANPTGRASIRVVNGSGGTLTVTIVSQSTDDGLAVADRTVSVTNGQVKWCGPFPTATYNDANGDVTLQFSATTSVTCEIITF